MPIGLLPLLILTLCGPERVLVVSTEPPDDLSCLTTPGVGRPGDGLLPVPLTGGGGGGSSLCTVVAFGVALLWPWGACLQPTGMVFHRVGARRVRHPLVRRFDTLVANRLCGHLRLALPVQCAPNAVDQAVPSSTHERRAGGGGGGAGMHQKGRDLRGGPTV